uniref:Uncharacterized protein n=1 Tax=Arundo donax TaxID=35708 RepID=A0A0A9A6U3_ARUDO
MEPLGKGLQARTLHNTSFNTTTYKHVYSLLRLQLLLWRLFEQTTG